ncbi:hypothetical protein BCR41DRAFT_247593 [Lobosporangium transversale]|uniref:Uncharacterized protein n=1 Tax=Lobosporangium transversale TaxID=64571 RepID=A0A1Y2GVN1_9FUNG|nr:hypothetical protein BCR41DRAFT_247593 [Lobosporangium transversale]ORZ23835.1 hypothetical protein BCR41DRAFT_247593 [Lobosporangium transversale]|eukprot:XP_021883649.1 hypothetical protein BCR41DRAFT_247593 [Lobosporangium transversale]
MVYYGRNICIYKAAFLLHITIGRLFFLLNYHTKRVYCILDLAFITSVFIVKRTGQMAGAIKTVLPVYFDFRISVAQTKAVEKDDKQSIQESKNDFTLKLYCDQTEISVQTDDLETLQGLLKELRRSHLIARRQLLCRRQ